MSNKTLSEIEEYNGLLKTEMFWEFYPQLSGNYQKDKDEWKLIYKQLQELRKCQIKKHLQLKK